MEVTSLPDKFWNCVEKGSGDNACWLWSGSKNNKGYGVCYLRSARGNKLAHRISFAFHKGHLADGVEVCHRCDTPSCVNPEHLFNGTHGDNMRDASNKKRFPTQQKVTCNSGHELTSENTYIYPSGLRGCRICRRRWQVSYIKNNPAKRHSTVTKYNRSRPRKGKANG